MQVTSRMRAGVTVVSLAGQVLRYRADVFGAWIRAEIGDGWTGPVLLDCEHLTYINSVALREILLVARRVAQHQGRFAICSLAEPLDRVFEIVGFDQIMDIHDSTEQALARLRQLGVYFG